MINEMLRATAAAAGEQCAIAYLDRRISYQELYRAVGAAAAGLRHLGITAGDCVLIAVTNCPEFVVGYLATARLRAKVCAIDPAAADPELRRCLDAVDPRLILTDLAHADRFDQLRSERHTTNTTIAVVGQPSGRFMPAEQLFRFEPAEPERPFAGDWSLAYSSGSTGNPKLVCRTQANQVAEAHNIVTSARLSTDDTILCVVPLFHAIGQFCCMIAAVRSGATLVLLERTAPEQGEDRRDVILPAQVGRILSLISELGVTVLPAVPYVYDLLSDVDPSVPVDLSRVRLFLSGGNFLPTATAEKFHRRYGQPIRQTYGGTEAGSVAWDCAEPDRAVPGSVGHPLQGVDVRILDGDGRPVSVGTVGEIAVRGPAVMTGYVNRPDLTAQVLVAGWYHTGDLGRFDEDGRLHITGRTNLLIDSGGRKVNPLEVESVLVSHDLVSQAMVAGVGTATGDHMLVAVVVPTGRVTAQELRRYCRERLTDYKVPQRIVFRSGLPLSPLGKVLRHQFDLSGLAEAQQPPTRPDVAGYLVDRLADLLQVPPKTIDVAKPILATGLDSLTAIRLRLAIEKDLGIHARSSQILGDLSLAELARQLEESGR